MRKHAEVILSVAMMTKITILFWTIMKIRLLFFIPLLFVLFSCATFAQGYELIKKPELQKEIIALYQRDQSIRKNIYQNGKVKTLDFDGQNKLNKLNNFNVKRLKAIIKKHGWPGISQIGQVAEGDAWALVQHADNNPEFQKKCLKLLQKAYNSGDTKGMQLAFLTDHIRIKEGRPQLYGTQAKIDFKNKNFNFLPIEDSVNIDKRRDKVGLMPLKEYYKLLMDSYFPKKKK